MCFCAIYVSSLMKCLLMSFAYFPILIVLFYCWVLRVLYIFYEQVLCWICGLLRFSPSLRFAVFCELSVSALCPELSVLIIFYSLLAPLALPLPTKWWRVTHMMRSSAILILEKLKTEPFCNKTKYGLSPINSSRSAQINIRQIALYLPTSRWIMKGTGGDTHGRLWLYAWGWALVDSNCFWNNAELSTEQGGMRTSCESLSSNHNDLQRERHFTSVSQVSCKPPPVTSPNLGLREKGFWEMWVQLSLSMVWGPVPSIWWILVPLLHICPADQEDRARKFCGYL